MFQRQGRNGGKRVRRIFGAGLEIPFRFLKQQPRLLLRQRCLRQTLHIGAHAVQIGHHAAVHLGKHAAFPPFAGDFGGSLKSRFRICAACEHDDLPVQLRLARFVGGNQQRVGLLLGGQQRGEVGLQPGFGGNGMDEKQAEQGGKEGVKTAEQHKRKWRIKNGKTALILFSGCLGNSAEAA